MIEDLNDNIQQQWKQEHQIIVIGDFIEVIGQNPKLLAKICDNNNLYDVHADRLEDITDIPTNKRGKTRLDYTVIFHKLKPRISSSSF